MTPDLFGNPAPLKALSLWQPWASLIAAGYKRHETRHWSTKVRGPIAICAANTLDRDGAPEELCQFIWGTDWVSQLPRGAVCSVVQLTDCIPTERARHIIADCDKRSGNYADGRFAFRLDNVQALSQPISVRGAQRFFIWTPPSDLAKHLLPAVDHIAKARAWLGRPA